MIAPLDKGKLGALPRTIPAIRRVVVRDETDSTNDDARRLGAQGAETWTVVIADRQSAGRGRRDRSWHSPAGLGLYISVLLRPRRPAPEIARWTLAAAAAAAETCSSTGAGGVTIKWPNDVLAAGRKVAGILAESRSAGGDVQELVVGAGFNVFHDSFDFPAPLRGIAVSLRMAGARAETTRESLAASWLERFADLAGELERGAWEDVARRWSAWARGAEGADVRVLPTDPQSVPVIGRTCGVDSSGALLVATADGETVAVRAAESVVPLEN